MYYTLGNSCYISEIIMLFEHTQINCGSILMLIEKPNGFGEEIVLCLFPSGIEVSEDLVTLLLWRERQVVTSNLFHCLHKLVNTAVTQQIVTDIIS